MVPGQGRDIPLTEWLRHTDRIHISKASLNQLVMNFLVIEGYAGAPPRAFPPVNPPSREGVVPYLSSSILPHALRELPLHVWAVLALEHKDSSIPLSFALARRHIFSVCAGCPPPIPPRSMCHNRPSGKQQRGPGSRTPQSGSRRSPAQPRPRRSQTWR